MPSMSANDAHDAFDDADLSSSTLDARLDREKNRSTKSSSSKSKDLSHVPCKFFRVGSCTAGSSCPFSHQISQPGQQKDVCAWFIKGNCKFGHKCALAHILPGQSPAMDRRNKKAAQLAAAAATSSNGGGGSAAKDRERDRERDARNRKTVSGTSVQAAGRSGTPSRSNTLLSGSTAPTRMLPSGARPPLPISISKAAPAPAETAPALHDADFTSHDAFNKTNEHAENGTSIQDAHADNDAQDNADKQPTNGVSSPNTAPFPVSTPPRPHRFTGRHGSSPSIDFGPVGSPPHASTSMSNSNPIRINGFSPGTSPRDPVQVTQPLAAGPTFSAPAANLFMNPSSPRGAGSGLAASLSLGGSLGPPPPPHTQTFAVGSLPVLSRPIADAPVYAEVLDDEDMEEFVPSSLKDLLTPEEQSRRMSRTSSSQTGGGIGGAGNIASPVSRAGVQREDSRHRHSRSVPSASLLSQNLRSIWSDSSGELGQENTGFGLPPSSGGTSALGVSPSYVSSPGLHAFDNDGPSPSMLSPSNASAAFLGLHQYMGPSRVPGSISGVRAVSQGHVHQNNGVTNTAFAGVNPSASSSFDALNNHRGHGHGHGLSSSPSHLARPPPFDAFSSSPSGYNLSQYRPVPAAPSATFRAPEQALSPASRALQDHVPGQSLPQGLAAGFSRIHLQPTTAYSPGSQGYDAGGSVNSNGSGFEWMSATPTKQYHFEPAPAAALPSPGNTAGSEHSVSTPSMNTETDVGGLTTMFSHLSYSSVAAGGLRGHGHHASPAAASAAVPTSMSRRSSARGWSSHPLSSPLSGPVLTNDDDDLFSMDEEK